MKNKTETIGVKGMHCKSCVSLIERKLSRLKGVEKAKADLVSETVKVSYDPNSISLGEIKGEIEELGYGAGSGAAKKKDGGLKQGIIYGIVPHTGCILFIAASVLGMTVATELFKPLLMNPYFFYILIGMSFVFATISSFLYLRNQGFIKMDRTHLSFASNTMQRKWKYLSTMYGMTIGINLLLFFFVFPALANFDSGPSITGAYLAAGGLDTVTLQVDIPCPGHAPLISGELKKVAGVQGVKFRMPNYFDVAYDSTTDVDGILSPSVFETYRATIVGSGATVELTGEEELFTGGCGCGG